MEVIFANSDLEELYVSGTSKRYRRVPDEIVKKFPRAVALLKAAKIIQEIWSFPGYRFEKLGGFPNRYSMRLGRTWRLEMDIDWQDEGCTVGVIGLSDLSSHYGD